MRITRLHVRNTLAVREVEAELDPDQNLVVVCGENNQGKSSLFRAIKAALIHKRFIPPDPRHADTNKAEAIIEFEDPANPHVLYRVEHTHEQRPGRDGNLKLYPGLTLTTINKDGSESVARNARSSLQALFDAAGAFNLSRFLQDDPGKHADYVHRALRLDTQQLDDEIEALENQRPQLRRKAQSLAQNLADGPDIPDDLPDQPPNVTKLVEKRDKLNQQAQALADATIDPEDDDELITLLNGWSEQVDNLTFIPKAKRKPILTAISNLHNLSLNISDTIDSLASFQTELEEINDQIANAGTIAEQIRQRDELEAVRDEHIEALEGLDTLESKLAKKRTQRRKIIAKALDSKRDLIPPRFEIDPKENRLLVDGRTYADHASSSDRIDLGIALSRVDNPSGITFVEDVSLLGPEKRAQLVERMARCPDGQLWLEIVGDAPDATIEMNAGVGTLAKKTNGKARPRKRARK